MSKITLYPKSIVCITATVCVLACAPLWAQHGWPYPDLKKRPESNEAMLQQAQLNQMWLANHAAMAQAMGLSSNGQNSALPSGQQTQAPQQPKQQTPSAPQQAQAQPLLQPQQRTHQVNPGIANQPRPNYLQTARPPKPSLPELAASRPIPLAAQSSNFSPSAQASLPTVPTTLVSTQDLLAGDGEGDVKKSYDDSSALESMGPSKGGIRSPHGVEKPLRDGIPEGKDPHIDLYIDNCYPSAITCAKCHPKVYEEWRGSAHAYAGISPMFNKFEMAIAQLSSGTIGTFCLRCHAPVAMHLGRPREASIIDYEQVVREGVTCVACHRVAEAYNRHNGERRIEAGSVFDPVFGSTYGEGLAKAIAEKDKYKIKVDPNDKRPGQAIHLTSIKFDQLSDSSFCASCHQVAVHPRYCT